MSNERKRLTINRILNTNNNSSFGFVIPPPVTIVLDEDNNEELLENSKEKSGEGSNRSREKMINIDLERL